MPNLMPKISKSLSDILDQYALKEGEYKKVLNSIMESKKNKGDLWVFGYGSLMWRPGFPYKEKQLGIVHGYHRSFCVYSHFHRGTKERPGLVLGLDKGDSCQGIAYRIAEENIQTEMQKIWEREMFAGTYIPTWVNVSTKHGNISAVTFIINHDHEHYIPDLELEEVIERVVRAEGICGSCQDYVKNTVKSLQRLGLQDSTMERLLNLIEYPKNFDGNE